MTISENLRSSWIDLRAREPSLRTVDAARTLGVREAELVAACCGAREPLAVRRLVDEPARLLGQLPALGVVKTITRNPQVVLEVEGRYQPVEFLGHTRVSPSCEQ
jgi:putative heme degradation protein